MQLQEFLISLKNSNHKIDLLIFTGVAGLAKEKIKKWDIFQPESVIQNDMDESPLFEKFIINKFLSNIFTSSYFER